MLDANLFGVAIITESLWSRDKSFIFTVTFIIPVFTVTFPFLSGKVATTPLWLRE